MDPLTAGATVLPFVILGLQSIKTAFGILSTYKDGKEQVSRTQKDVNSLLSILERLSKSRIITRNQDLALAAMVIECADDITAIDEKLKELTGKNTDEKREETDNNTNEKREETGNNTDSLLKRHLKKIKIFFKADDLKKMSTILSRHTTSLNLHLNTTQRFAYLSISGCVKTWCIDY